MGYLDAKLTEEELVELEAMLNKEEQKAFDALADIKYMRQSVRRLRPRGLDTR